MPSIEVQKQRLMCVLSGKVVVSGDAGFALREWRDKFGVSQARLAEEVGVGASVLSDYERGRRDEPGVGVVRRYVRGLVEIDHREGGEAIRYYYSKYPLAERHVSDDPPTA